ncbi:hypothetical protein ABG808_04365 [Streptococcus iniae]
MSDSDEGLETLSAHLLKTMLEVPNYHLMIIDALGEFEYLSILELRLMLVRT